MDRVLVTGVAGYVGSVLARQLLENGFRVLGIDSLMYGGNSLLGIYGNKNFEFIKSDIRNSDILHKALQNDVFAVIHLAAIVGDPACKINEKLAEEVNWESSKNLFNIIQEIKNIKHFIFASTCSNYGKMPNTEFVNENSPLNPISLYAKLKVLFENYVYNKKKREDLVTTILRFATVYGISPRMRFDLTVNEFIKEVSMDKELLVFGENFWRPYCHVDDIARACILILKNDVSLVNNEIFGVGDTNENYQKKMIVNEILKIIPGSKIKYVQIKDDPRDYKVDFTKIKNTLGFKISKTVPLGLQEVHSLIKNNILFNPDSKEYMNI